MKKTFFLLAALLVTEIILAPVCAPYSCDWGNTVYFYAGLFALIASFVLAILQKAWRPGKRIGYGFLFVLITAVVWIACFMLFDFKIMCRMF